METELFHPSRLPAPDEMGFFVHPDVPGEDESDDVAGMLAALGYEWSIVDFADDATGGQVDMWYASMSRDIVIQWTPSHPPGEGWILAAKTDTENGLVALFVRPQSTAFNPRSLGDSK